MPKRHAASRSSSSSTTTTAITTSHPFLLLLLATAALAMLTVSHAWFLPPSSSMTPRLHPHAHLHTHTHTRPQHTRNRGLVQCNGINGWGQVDDRYSWHETEFEVEVSVPVPPTTTKHDVLFKASATSLKLGLVNATTLLLGGKLKGRIALDGTYWSLEGEGEERAVKLLLEKKAGALENSWDWRRVMAEEPATESKYEEAEKFNTQEYISQMLGPGGVNMSLVDRDMFGGAGGMMGNVTKETLREYVDAKVLDDASGLFGKKVVVQGREGGKEEEEEEEEEES